MDLYYKKNNFILTSNYTIELQPFILYIYFNLCNTDVVDQTYSHINIVYFYLCIY